MQHAFRSEDFRQSVRAVALVRAECDRETRTRAVEAAFLGFIREVLGGAQHAFADD
jgi:hypothetical protein